MHVHRPLLTAALLVAGVALAQSPGTSPSSPQTTPPPPTAGGSSATTPGSTGSDTRSAPAPRGEPLPPPVSSAAGTSPTPEAILADLHLANESEVDLGKVAEQRAQNKDVKAFGKHMVKAHTRMDKDAQAWAKKHRVSFGTAPQGPAQQAEMQKMQETKQKLQTLSGSEFDKAYMQAMAEDHAADLQKVTAFEEQVTDKSFKKLLDSARKEIASHKRDADKLLQKLGSTASR